MPYFFFRPSFIHTHIAVALLLVPKGDLIVDGKKLFIAGSSWDIFHAAFGGGTVRLLFFPPSVLVLRKLGPPKKIGGRESEGEYRKTE